MYRQTLRTIHDVQYWPPYVTLIIERSKLRGGSAAVTAASVFSRVPLSYLVT